ncbi:hypothetical protein CQA53_10865 [Helicobacter didelphidarum]|uniref:Glycine zipper domain-containing protein n=1 Tax=Helicobacter didelphidarum TaxID=2040648 RepID=A0A3D8I5J1_9HELI|nr:hypothetical protein [Helicobacter didelphidarum]RDU60413.1 hypothetical protein CQA53_10865 [Helicobacter didelphidarum]
MSSQKSIYASLNLYNCEFNDSLPQRKKVLNDLGSTTDTFLSIYLPANSAFVSAMSDMLYPKKTPFYIPNAPTITLGVNYGVIAYFFKKAEGKSDKRAAGEATFEFVASYLGGKAGEKIATKTATRLGVSVGSRILAGAATGAALGSTAPVVGTIIGAVVGSLIAFGVEYLIFDDTDKEAELHNAEIERLEKAYNLKINRINDYLVRNKYIELRILDDIESEILCKEASNLKSSYFKTILLMQSFPNYLDRDKEFYDTLQQKELDTSKDSKERTSKETDKAQSKEPKITPIANAIPITIEIEKCYDGASGNLLKNTTIYLYNHRFKRVVAKGQSDERGKLIVHNVYVGQENTIDKVSFVVDRDNFDERVA